MTIDRGDDRPERGSEEPARGEDRPGRGAHGALAIVVAARDEAERIGATLAALAQAFPGATLWVADDGSRDATARLAREAGARVLGSGRPLGKGDAMTAAVRQALRTMPSAVLLCDGDLGSSAARLGPLVEALGGAAGEEAGDGAAEGHGAGTGDEAGTGAGERHGGPDLAIATFSRRMGGGFGLALAFARFAIRRRCGFEAAAPLSGQRALGRAALEDVLPFAHGFGMEVGMTIDALLAGRAVVELELDLDHRASGRTLGGFAHRGRQLLDVLRAVAARR
ncbi:MAG: glycosyltransferase [Solirubrobacteraceae bacterium]